ncbi:hypothetical protein TNCV_4668891 [Trichonephila clavipes]|nr:hypothetical protein TNCV_4668891 [Trichonephila clavipes]
MGAGGGLRRQPCSICRSGSEHLYLKARQKLRENPARVIEREIRVFLHKFSSVQVLWDTEQQKQLSLLHKFLEESRGSRTRPNGRQYHQNGHQNHRQLAPPK